MQLLPKINVLVRWDLEGIERNCLDIFLFYCLEPIGIHNGKELEGGSGKSITSLNGI